MTKTSSKSFQEGGTSKYMTFFMTEMINLIDDQNSWHMATHFNY